MRICCLDIAGQTGVAFGEPGEKPTLLTANFTREGEGSSMDGVAEAAGRAIQWFAEFTMVEKFDRLVIEAPIPEAALGGHTNAWSTALKFALCGALGGAARLRGIELRFANIQRVRKFVIGRGNVRSELAKPAVMVVCRALGWKPKNRDEGDAGAVFLWACSEVAPAKTPRLDPISLGISPFEFPTKARRKGVARVAA